jgi:hypothetical protein
MNTLIESNGSKWAGESPDSLETLIEVLGKYVLDPRFEVFGKRMRDGDWEMGIPEKYRAYTHHYHGNFLELSHVFRIFTADAEVIAKLDAAIAANLATAEFREAKAEYEREKAERAQRQALGGVFG